MAIRIPPAVMNPGIQSLPSRVQPEGDPACHARPLQGHTNELPGFARLRQLTIGAQVTNLPHRAFGAEGLA